MNLDLYNQFGLDENSLYLTKIINDNLDRNKTCHNCRWNKEAFCAIEKEYMVERVDHELRTCEGWENFIPSFLILKNHIQ